MPITSYKIIVGKNSKELQSALAEQSLVPVGDVLTSSFQGYAVQAAGAGTVDIGTATEYQVLTAKTPSELEGLVSDKITAGFQPVGGVQKWYNAFIQAVGNVAESDGGGDPATWDTLVGKPAVIAAGADAAAARTAIGAGTSNLVIGTSASQAKAGNYTPPNVTTSANGLMLSADKTKLDGIEAGANKYTLPDAGAAIGGVKRGAAVADAAEGTELETINFLLASLRASGAIAS